ncbi:DUF4125 family protein [Dorea sp. AF36-15AT]|uniref:DUF4125 family protein n=1 Tax=Dorea sp. AF36-15AT TaxID=2292041 RepID=UPI001FA9AF85|nr:DUF4125 family protein [Dorea sp. AF36-15AT]
MQDKKEMQDKMEEREALIDEVIEREWEQFQNVQNEGGRASCQDDHETFVIMRKSQFMNWTQELLESYRQDLIEAEAAHWNLLTEKYARMMESTAPERYAELADILPKRSKERIQMQEEMIAQQIRWEEDFAAKFPGVASTGRVIHTSEDTPWDTSIETYARGEISTYSDRTVGLLKKLYDQMAADHENLSEKTLRNMTVLYGYESLEEAEKQQRARLER